MTIHKWNEIKSRMSSDRQQRINNEVQSQVAQLEMKAFGTINVQAIALCIAGLIFIVSPFMVLWDTSIAIAMAVVGTIIVMAVVMTILWEEIRNHVI